MFGAKLDDKTSQSIWMSLQKINKYRNGIEKMKMTSSHLEYVKTLNKGENQ